MLHLNTMDYHFLLYIKSNMMKALVQFKMQDYIET